MKTVCAFLYAAASTVLAALVMGLALGGLSPRIAVIALTIGAVVGTCSMGLWRRGDSGQRRIGPWDWVAIVGFALFALRSFLWVVFTTGDEIRVLSPNNLGDLSLHLTYIRELANGVPLWPENPIVAGAKLTYPLGVDLLHALLFLSGADLYRTFAWLGLLGAAGTGIALWRWGRGLAIAAFLCNGGLAALALLESWRLADFQAEAAWKSLPLALFVTQRGFLFALPAGLALLASWRARFLGEGSQREVLPRWGELLLYAAMPVFHLHTFIFLSLMLLGWFAMQARARREIFTLVALAVIPATLLTFEVTDHFHGPKSIGWQLGWMQSDPAFLAACERIIGTQNPLVTVPVFWFYNFGVLPVLVGWLGLELAWPRDASAEVRAARWSGLCLYVPALAIFLLCCVVKFAAWEWDNTKLMIWSYLLMLPLLWQHLLVRWPAWARSSAVVALFFSGALSLVGGLDSSHRGYPIGRRSELDALEVALREVPVDARIVAQPAYNHPLLLLGRPLAMGYEGHVWSHGYEFGERKAVVLSILNGEAGWQEEARALGCRYLFWGAMEEADGGKSTRPWESVGRVVFSVPQGTLYEIGAR
jgi:hypothetical protein